MKYETQRHMQSKKKSNITCYFDCKQLYFQLRTFCGSPERESGTAYFLWRGEATKNTLYTFLNVKILFSRNFVNDWPSKDHSAELLVVITGK